MNVKGLTHLGIGRNMHKTDIGDEVIITQRRLEKQRADSPHANRLRGDGFERSPNIEYFNNYSRRGTLVDADIEYARSTGQAGPQPAQETEAANPAVIPDDEPDAVVNPQSEAENLPASIHSNSANTTLTAPAEASETNLFKSELYSIYTKPGVEVFVSSANHSQPVLFGNSQHPELKRITEYINRGIQDFMADMNDVCEITQIIENAYRDILDYNISLGNTDGTDPYYNARLLFNTQGYFSYLAGSATIQANNAEGNAYAKDLYGLIPGDGFVYYNAKYHYLDKALQEIGTSAINQIAKSEGFDFFSAKDSEQNSFNITWQTGAGNAKMMSTDIEPQKDFTMFFTSLRFSFQDVWNNGGKNVMITASDPTRTDGHGTTTCFFTVPKNWQMFKSLPLWLKQGTYTNEDGKKYVTWDITKHIKFNAGDDLHSRIKEFFDEHLNDPNHGELIVWSGGTKSVHNVPFDLWFNEKRAFQGSELTAAVEHNNFISNFELRIF